MLAKAALYCCTSMHKGHVVAGSHLVAPVCSPLGYPHAMLLPAVPLVPPSCGGAMRLQVATGAKHTTLHTELHPIAQQLSRARQAQMQPPPGPPHDAGAFGTHHAAPARGPA